MSFGLSYAMITCDFYTYLDAWSELHLLTVEVNSDNPDDDETLKAITTKGWRGLSEGPARTVIVPHGTWPLPRDANTYLAMALVEGACA